MAAETISQHILIQAVLQVQLAPRIGYLQSQVAVLIVRVALVATIFAEDLAAGFEAEDLEDRGLALVLYHIALDGLGVLEARLYQVVQESQQELLSILLHSMAVAGHYLAHEGRDHVHTVAARLVSSR